MTQQLLRPLRQCLRFHYHSTYYLTLPLHLLTLPPKPTTPTSHRFSTSFASSRRDLRLPNAPLPSTDSDTDYRKSRNQLKREAKRAVKWGMDLASFSVPQIKRILRVVSLGPVVLEALMLVKRLGPDVREGRRRQFNYIGKLLREVDPELMDRLIKATKDSDQKELQALTGLGSDDLDDDDVVESEYEEGEEESDGHDNQVTRWSDGLINKDIEITNEVYSVQGVEFDRQELRKLVRRVQSSQEMEGGDEEEGKKIESATIGAKKALTRFLRGLSKRIPNDY
ncbi:hypothetical protein RJT34_25627 [Clitoria ternatea]|uniref:Uncharacterized protein n=1 Tax=Clitoria ternatea TaxID=43366 RepID=A0AAN9FY50_CLITE